jgi:hypothetical protein
MRNAVAIRWTLGVLVLMMVWRSSRGEDDVQPGEILQTVWKHSLTLPLSDVTPYPPTTICTFDVVHTWVLHCSGGVGASSLVSAAAYWHATASCTNQITSTVEHEYRNVGDLCHA